MGAVVSDQFKIQDPDGHTFYVTPNEAEFTNRDPIYKVQLNTHDLKKTTGLTYQVVLVFVLKVHCLQHCLEWRSIPDKVERCSGSGRVAFAVPTKELEPIQKKVEEAKQQILTPLEKLDTPGKAAVQVVILADPNDHEICFVGDEAYRELSRVDPEAEKKLLKAIDEDDSAKYKKPAE
ncbi:unnamed protein product [Gongylonema pulchrum]|uniref:Glyoxalase domain-containing protein 4 n=1 Tax=Gongylonema pulchrum TaxID=637853 RepID=A0A183E4Y7_9BILA|nr:unnamed protein product [Gongylonema pulchrum]